MKNQRLLELDKRLSVEDRTLSYRKTFPNFCPLQICGGRIYGIWLIGNAYERDTKYYGAYPHNLKLRILSLFPDCNSVMHLFSGTLDEGITYDIKPELNPTICDDVRNLPTHKNIIKNIDLVMADPPYETSDFEKYECKPFDKTRVFIDLASCMKSGSFLTWLDTRLPMYSKKSWNFLGYIGVILSTKTRIRCLSLYQRR